LTASRPVAYPAFTYIPSITEVVQSLSPKSGHVLAIVDSGADTCIAYDARLLVDITDTTGLLQGVGQARITHRGTLRFEIDGEYIEDKMALVACPQENSSLALILSAPRLASLSMLRTIIGPTDSPETIGFDPSGQQLYRTQQLAQFGRSHRLLPLHETRGASGLHYCYLPLDSFPHLRSSASLYSAVAKVDIDRLTLAHRRIHKPLAICSQIIQDTQLESHCQFCLEGHNTAESTGKLALVPATQPGEKVHFDCFKTGLSMFPNAYIFVDAFTKYKQVYFTSRRRVENLKTCTDMWIARTNRWFTTQEMIADQAAEHEAIKSLLIEEHIQLRTRSSYSSVLNGIAERSIRTVIEDAGTLYAASGLPSSAIIYVVKAAIYLSNILPGSKPSPAALLNLPRPFGLLRVLGCRAFIHNFKRKKIIGESRVSLGYLVGYSFEDHHVGCYLVWRPESGKVIATRHVVFDERRTFRDAQVSYHIIRLPIPGSRNLSTLKNHRHLRVY